MTEKNNSNQSDKIQAFVASKLDYFKKAAETSEVHADLAHLRRGIGKEPGELPQLWKLTFDLPDPSLRSKGYTPSYAQWSIHLTLTLFALHQQGKDLQQHAMHQSDLKLGHAIRRLANCEKYDEDAIQKRFNILATSQSIKAFAHHLRGIVQLLKSEDIPLDYVALSSDIYWFQYPQYRKNCRLRWGQDFYTQQKQNTDSDHTQEQGA